MSTTPPYPVEPRHFGSGFSPGVRVNGIWYDPIGGTSVAPDYAVTRMAKWLQANKADPGYDVQVWLGILQPPSYDHDPHSNERADGIMEAYVTALGDIPNVPVPHGITHPGEPSLDNLGPIGDAIGSIGSVVDFLKLLTRPELWVRIGEVTIGVLLIGVGVHAALKDRPVPPPIQAGFQRYASNARTSVGGLGSKSGSIHYDRSTTKVNGVKLEKLIATERPG